MPRKVASRRHRDVNTNPSEENGASNDVAEGSGLEERQVESVSLRLEKLGSTDVLSRCRTVTLTRTHCIIGGEEGQVLLYSPYGSNFQTQLTNIAPPIVAAESVDSGSKLCLVTQRGDLNVVDISSQSITQTTQLDLGDGDSITSCAISSNWKQNGKLAYASTQQLYSRRKRLLGFAQTIPGVPYLPIALDISYGADFFAFRAQEGIYIMDAPTADVLLVLNTAAATDGYGPMIWRDNCLYTALEGHVYVVDIVSRDIVNVKKHVVDAASAILALTFHRDSEIVVLTSSQEMFEPVLTVIDSNDGACLTKKRVDIAHHVPLHTVSIVQSNAILDSYREATRAMFIAQFTVEDAAMSLGIHMEISNADDEMQRLITSHNFTQAMEMVTRCERVRKWTPSSVSAIFLKHCLANRCFKDATAFCARWGTVPLWESWIPLLIQYQSVSPCLGSIPVKDPLPKRSYDLILQNLLEVDHSRFLDALRLFDSSLYSRQSLLQYIIESQMERTPPLQEAIVVLEIANKDVDKAYSGYLNMRDDVLGGLKIDRSKHNLSNSPTIH